MADQRPTRTLRRRTPSEAEPQDTTPAPPPRKPRTSSGGIRSGWDAGQQTMDSTSSFAQNLQLTEQTQVIKFLSDSPYATFIRHWVRTPQGQRTHTCLQTKGIDRDCPLCAAGVRQQAVAAFNVVVCNDDGSLTHKSWDAGPRLFNTLKSFHNDPKIGPLSKNFFGVSRSGKKGSSDTHVLPIRASSLEEDYDIIPPSQDELDEIEGYDASIIQITDDETLEELATTQESVDGDGYR